MDMQQDDLKRKETGDFLHISRFVKKKKQNPTTIILLHYNIKVTASYLNCLNNASSKICHILVEDLLFFLFYLFCCIELAFGQYNIEFKNSPFGSRKL